LPAKRDAALPELLGSTTTHQSPNGDHPARKDAPGGLKIGFIADVDGGELWLLI
jgi:hypothetical protein